MVAVKGDSLSIWGMVLGDWVHEFSSEDEASEIEYTLLGAAAEDELAGLQILMNIPSRMHIFNYIQYQYSDFDHFRQT